MAGTSRTRPPDLSDADLRHAVRSDPHWGSPRFLERVGRATFTVIGAIVMLPIALIAVIGVITLVIAGLKGIGILHDTDCSQPAKRERIGTVLAEGGDVNATVTCDVTPLVFALQTSDMALLGDLLDAGADPNRALMPTGRPVLEHALEADQFDIAEILVDAGALVDARTDTGGTLLDRALLNGDAEIAKFLLDNGANPDGHPTPATITDFGHANGSTLVVTAYLGDAEAVALLLDAGADPDQLVRLGHPMTMQALDWIVPSMSEKPDASPPSEPVARALMTRDEIAADPLLIAVAQHGTHSALQRIAEGTASDTGSGTASGTRPVRSTPEQWMAIADALLLAGAPVEGAEGVSVSPLYLAARLGDREMVELLLAAGAEPTREVAPGWTPAAAARAGGWLDLVAVLEPTP